MCKVGHGRISENGKNVIEVMDQFLQCWMTTPFAWARDLLNWNMREMLPNIFFLWVLYWMHTVPEAKECGYESQRSGNLVYETAN